MIKSVHRNKQTDGPPVLRFTARLCSQSKPEKTDSSIVLELPKTASLKLRGMTKVEGTINGHPFRAPLERRGSGSFDLCVTSAMLRGARAKVGEIVKLAILGPEPKLTIPTDLRIALAASRDATTLWKDLTDLGRRDYVRWIEGAKTPQTRARRVTRTVEQLSEGKRRPCCANVYEFMLRRIDGE